MQDLSGIAEAFRALNYDVHTEIIRKQRNEHVAQLQEMIDFWGKNMVQNWLDDAIDGRDE